MTRHGADGSLMNMFRSILMALLLSVPAGADPGAERAAAAFAEALMQDQPRALKALGVSSARGSGSADFFIEGHDQIVVTSRRAAGTEQEGGATFLLVELEGTAVTAGRRRPVPMPRWWSLELAAEGTISSIVMLERRLALRLALAPPEQLEAAILRPEIDPTAFLVELVDAASDQGDPGLPAIRWAREEARTRGLVRAECAALEMLAYVPAIQGKGDEAVPPAQEGMALAEASGNPDILVGSAYLLGISLWVADRVDEAVATLRRAGELADRIDNPAIAGRAFTMAGYIEGRRGRLRERLAYAERHEQVVTRYPTLLGAMDAAFTLGTIHQQLGNGEVARAQYLRAFDRARELGGVAQQAMALFNLAALDAERGETAAAGELLDQALETGKCCLPPPAMATMRLLLATMQRENGDFDGATESLAWALDAARTADERQLAASVLTERAALHLAAGRLDDAIADARKARLFRGMTDGMTRIIEPRSFAGALTVEGRALRAAGRAQDAEAAWRTAIDLVEEERLGPGGDDANRAAFFAERLAPYRELLDLYVDQGCARDALLIAEQMRARSLRDALEAGRIDLSEGLDAVEKKREEELEQQLSERNRAVLANREPKALERLTRERDEVRLALRRFRAELHLRHPELGGRRPGSLDTLPEEPIVRAGEVALEAVVGEQSALLFVVRAGEISVHRIPVARAELEARVIAFLTALEKRDLEYRESARGLYELLLGQAAPALAEARSLRVVPDGILWRLPFHALVGRDGKHVADRAVVAYSPSLIPAGNARREAPAARGTLLALADPRIEAVTAGATRSLYRSEPLGRLPEAAAEARAIAPLYPDAVVRVGEEAREAFFKKEAERFRVLHLAAHSILDDGAPLFSSVVLAAAGNDPLEDGLLEAREIAKLDLRADIAVLSACETARGKVTAGEGVVGLSWGFLVAGVPTTVVSQWKVSSPSTAALMVAFHRRLTAGASAPDALGEAMTALRRDPRWRHPFHWAPFVVIESLSK
ncbi:MAG TPA: CHAT domain-containing protein [Thermoanaerobaculia bacterium]|nr:CHAT domain-containing protein [Thermoanaerobaculia bacterium]